MTNPLEQELAMDRALAEQREKRLAEALARADLAERRLAIAREALRHFVEHRAFVTHGDLEHARAALTEIEHGH